MSIRHYITRYTRNAYKILMESDNLEIGWMFGMLVRGSNSLTILSSSEFLASDVAKLRDPLIQTVQWLSFHTKVTILIS